MAWNSDPQHWGREQLACGGPKGEGMGRQAGCRAEDPDGRAPKWELCTSGTLCRNIPGAQMGGGGEVRISPSPEAVIPDSRFQILEGSHGSAPPHATRAHTGGFAWRRWRRAPGGVLGPR